MFRLVHHFLLREFEERGRAEGRADGEESQGRVLGLAVLPVEHLDSPSHVQPLRSDGWAGLMMMGNVDKCHVDNNNKEEIMVQTINMIIIIIIIII